jgi:hypothetical protein
MVYERVKKNTSSWNPAFHQEKSESLFKPRPFSIQPEADTEESETQEIPAYSRADRDAISAKLLKTMGANVQTQAETESQKPESESEGLESDEVSPEAETLQRQEESPESGDDDENSPNGGAIQRQQESSDNEDEELSPEAGAIQRQQESSDNEDDQIKSVQTKLNIGAPGDKYEQEADAVAERVMSMNAPANPQVVQRQGESQEELIQKQPLSASITPLIQRFSQEEVQTQPLVQKAGESGASQAGASLESRLSSQKGGGSPLDDEVKGFMEPRFGTDFSSVRIHTGGDAVQMNRELGAQAFTHGSDVYFGAGKSPGNNDLTAHELTHVVQQTGSVRRKLDDDSQTQKSDRSVTNSQTDQSVIATDETNGAQTKTHLAVASGTEATHQVDSKQETSLTQPSLPTVTDSTVPAQAHSEAAHSSSSIAGESGNAIIEKSAAAESSNDPHHGEVANELADVHSHAKQSEAADLHQPMPEAAGHSTHLDKGSEQSLEDIAEAEPPQELLQIPQPAMPESPDLAQAAQQILQKAEVEKAALSQATQAQHNALMQQAEATAKAIEGTTQSKIQAIIAELDSKKTGVKQTINTTKATVKGQLANQKIAAQAEGTKALGALRKEVETKRKEAIEASETEAKQTENTGQIEAQRVITSSAESSTCVHAVANQKANSSSRKPEVQSTVRQAVGQTASDVTGKMQQRSQDLAKNAKEASQKTAKGLRDAGKQLSSGIGTNTTQVEKAIQDGTNATVNQMATQEVQYQQKLDALQVQALTSLEKLKASSIAGIKQSGQMGAAAARKIGQATTTQINKAKAASLQQLDKGVHQVVSKLNQVPAGRKVDNKEVEKFVQEVGNKLQQANIQLGVMIADQATSSQTSLNQLGAVLPGHLDSTQQKVNAEANKATGSLSSGVAEVPAKITQASQQAISENKSSNQQAVQQFGDGLQQQIDKAKQGWSQEKEKVSNDIRGKIDEGVKSNKDVESKAPADFSELATTAAVKAEESLASKIFRVFSGIWEGIKKVAIGLAIFVAVVLVITGVVLLVAAIASIAVVASEVLLAVAAIVGVGFLLYGLITAAIKRSDDFWKTYGTNIPWYQKAFGFLAVLGLSIGDTVGITPIIEGIIGKEAFTGKKFTPEQQAEKITEGVLTIALMVIMGKVLKGLGKPGEVKSPISDPIKDPVDPIKDPVDPIKDPVDPIKDPVDPIKDPVDPIKDPVDPIKDPVDPIKDPVDPIKYNPKTKTDAELQLDKDPTPRPGETPQEAAERSKMAQDEIVERVMERYNGLGEKPPHVDMAANDAAHTDAHTGQRHGSNIPEARSLDANSQPDGTRTIEGRIYGDPPWNQPGGGGKQNFSAKWLSQDILNQTVNRYLKNNWEQIRSDLAVDGEHSNSFDAGQIVGKGYFNKNFGQPGGPVAEGPAVTPMVFIAIKFVPGNPPSFYIITTYPTLRGF